MEDWSEAFYVTTFTDLDAIASPRLSPRGRKIYGPFAGYIEAAEYGKRQVCTHFEVSRRYVRPGVVVPYLDERGNPIPGLLSNVLSDDDRRQ